MLSKLKRIVLKRRLKNEKLSLLAALVTVNRKLKALEALENKKDKKED